MKNLIAISFLLFFACSCNSNPNKKEAAENDIDAARTFIRSALDGDYEKAKKFMIQDSLNLEDLNTAIRLNERLSPDEKRGYREATIRIFNKRSIDDSTSIITYSNSYRNRTDSLKVVQTNGTWLVDFKYIFQHKKN